MLYLLLVLFVCLPLGETRKPRNTTDDTDENVRIACIREKRGLCIANKFLRYFEIQRLLAVYKRLYSHVNVFSIGSTHEKRQILAIKFSTGNCSKKLVIVEAGIHAREWLNIASTLMIIERMATKYGVDPEVDELLNMFNWIFIPVLNPDGYEYSHTTNRMWRKNRRPNNNGCFGVDLNRNFDVHWDGQNASEPCNDKYRGPAVNSEPETQALVGLVSSSNHQPIVAYLSAHNYGQMILTPYGSSLSEPPNGPLLRELGQSAADAIKKLYGRTFRVGSAAKMVYIGYGIATDWVYSQNVNFSYVFELRPDRYSQIGFKMPTTEIVPSYRELFAAIQAIVRGIRKLGY